MNYRVPALTCLLLIASTPLFAQGAPGMKMPPPQVALATATIKTVPVSFEYVGMTEASKTVEIRARVQGFLESREFLDGAWLKEGTRLFTIDARPFKADREIAAAQVAQAQARLDLAEQELKRVRSVRTPGAVAATDVDQRTSEVANAAAALRLAKAELEKANLNLEYTTVTAPLTGYIGKAQKEIGSYVDAQNSLLATIQQVDPLYVSFKVSESDFLTWKRQIRDGQLVLVKDVKALNVKITLQDGTSFENVGTLDFENTNVDLQTGTVELRATFKNEERLLKPGQFVKVQLVGWEQPNVLTIPQRAVSVSPQGSSVYIVGSDKKAETKTIKTGALTGQEIIVTEGLKEGDQVVVEGLTKLRPGIEVAIDTAPTDKASAPQPDSSTSPKPSESTTK